MNENVAIYDELRRASLHHIDDALQTRGRHVVKTFAYTVRPPYFYRLVIAKLHIDMHTFSTSVKVQ